MALYAAAVGLALPWLLRPRLEGVLTNALGLQTTIDALRVDPFALSITARGIEASEPDGSPFLRCEAVSANLQVASLWHRALVLRSFTLSKPFLHVAVDRKRRLNLAALPLFSRKQGSGPSGLPPLSVGEVEIDAGDLLFTDLSRKTPFREEVAPIHVQLEQFSTFADRSAPYALRATTADGDSFEWEGMLAFRPVRSEGSFHAVGTLPETAWRYLQDLLHFEVGNASLEVSTHYALQDQGGKLAVSLDGGELRLRNLSLTDRTSRRTVLRIPGLDVEDVDFDLATRRITIGSLSSRGGTIGILREKSGALELPRLLTPRREETAPPPAPPSRTAGRGGGSGLEIHLGKLAIDDYQVDLEDLTTSPPAKLQAKEVSLHGSGLSSAPGKPEKVTFRLGLGSGGRLAIDGTITPRPLSAELAVSLDGLELRPLQPYLGKVAKLQIEGGRAGLQGRLALAAADGAGKDPRWRYQGKASVDDLRVSEPGHKTELAGWNALRLDGVSLELAPDALAVADVLLQKPVLHLRRAANGELDTGWWLGRSTPPGGASGGASRGDASFPIRIGQLKVSDASASMIDDSVKPAVESVLGGLDATLNGFEMPGSRAADLTLKGELNDEAPLSIQGELGAPLSRAPTEVEVEMSNYGMTSLNPYAARYIGQTIDQGKLSLDATFRLSGSEVDSRNRLVLDQFALGHRVESPEAASVPLGLAMALLRDSKGRITLDVPVKGDISSPGFSYRAQFGKALVNVIRKVASSPFAVVGSLVGGGPELGYVDFAPGSDALEPEQVEKVDTLAKALKDRPGLILEIRGTASPELDGPGKKEALLELARRRADAIRDRLVTSDGVDAERVFVLAPVERPATVGTTQVRTDLSLTAR